MNEDAFKKLTDEDISYLDQVLSDKMKEQHNLLKEIVEKKKRK